MVDRLGELPSELLWRTLFKSSYEDIVNICSTNSQYDRTVCQDPIFWKMKFKDNHPELSDLIEDGLIDASTPQMAITTYLSASTILEEVTPNALFKILGITLDKLPQKIDVLTKYAVSINNRAMLALINKETNENRILWIIIEEDNADLYKWYENVYGIDRHLNYLIYDLFDGGAENIYKHVKDTVAFTVEMLNIPFEDDLSSIKVIPIEMTLDLIEKSKALMGKVATREYILKFASVYTRDNQMDDFLQLLKQANSMSPLTKNELIHIVDAMFENYYNPDIYSWDLKPWGIIAYLSKEIADM